ncbi:MAG: gamma-glutamyl-gamma-aminobutyrate hydrolase family protein [Ardenticatenaceae bacterium]
MRPIIGLTTYGQNEGATAIQSRHYDEFYYIPAKYVAAVRRAGGVPVLLPPGEMALNEWLDLVDGVVLIGGVDVDPEQYGGDAQNPSLTGLDAERDQTEMGLIELVIERGDRPTLCICRGLQVMNVALGGTLHEHLPDVLSEDIHRSESGGWTVQPVDVAPDSLLAQAMQTQQVSTYSGHHQGIKRLAKGVRVTATAPDGIIEAIEHEQHPWLVAVQWHPEMSAHHDPTQQRLFDALVAAATTTTD